MEALGCKLLDAAQKTLMVVLELLYHMAKGRETPPQRATHSYMQPTDCQQKHLMTRDP